MRSLVRRLRCYPIHLRVCWVLHFFKNLTFNRTQRVQGRMKVAELVTRHKKLTKSPPNSSTSTRTVHRLFEIYYSSLHHSTMRFVTLCGCSELHDTIHILILIIMLLNLLQRQQLKSAVPLYIRVINNIYFTLCRGSSLFTERLGLKQKVDTSTNL